jgi:hypothetical protein
MIKPAIPQVPTPPKLGDQFGPAIVITAKDANYFADACAAWEEKEGEIAVYTAEDMKKQYPGLSRSAACDWAIYGQTVQGNLNLENIFILQATYAEQMRAHVKFLTEVIDRMYDLSEEVRAEATKPLPEPEKKWYQQ